MEVDYLFVPAIMMYGIAQHNCYYYNHLET